MRPPRSFPLLLAAAALVLSGWMARAGETAGPSDAALIARIGERVAAYYQRVQRLICTERSTVVPVGSADNLPLARTVESELRVEIDGAVEPRMTREVQRINGRAPRERDKTERSGCTDPTPLSPELLAFLLPERRDDYSFTTARVGRERDRAAVVIDFLSARRGSRPELIEDEYGHDDCFDWTGSGRGRRPPLGRRRDPRRAAARSSHHGSDRRARIVTPADQVSTPRLADNRS